MISAVLSEKVALTKTLVQSDNVPKATVRKYDMG